MKPQSATVEIFKGIRSDIQSVRAEVQSVRAEVQSLRTDVRAEVQSVRDELHSTRDVLSGSIDAMRRQLVDSKIRTATAMTDLAGSVHEMTSVLRGQSDLRPRVERCEGEIAQLEQRLPPSRGR
jgi:chromosome segregation ATPase